MMHKEMHFGPSHSTPKDVNRSRVAARPPLGTPYRRRIKRAPYGERLRERPPISCSVAVLVSTASIRCRNVMTLSRNHEARYRKVPHRSHSCPLSSQPFSDRVSFFRPTSGTSTAQCFAVTAARISVLELCARAKRIERSERTKCSPPALCMHYHVTKSSRS